ncbi:MAG TPA: hypothetical protein VLE97_09625 [Gaiellaceae bacterium]|nr:hypothetical protein [Gaiellaceae bacterium]
MSAWDADQVRAFARQIADAYKESWWSFHAKIRDALVSHHVLMILLSQRGQVGGIHRDDVRELRSLIVDKLADKHGMRIDS